MIPIDVGFKTEEEIDAYMHRMTVLCNTFNYADGQEALEYLLNLCGFYETPRNDFDRGRMFVAQQLMKELTWAAPSLIEALAHQDSKRFRDYISDSRDKFKK